MEHHSPNDMIYADEYGITISTDYEYSIPKDQIATLQGVLQRAHHLSGKPWMTPRLIRRFIELACEYSNLPLH